MDKFVCKNCNYTFESEKIKKECPYCGAHEVVRQLSAEDLVEGN